MSTIRGPDVITAWGVGNGLLLGILIGYGDRVIAVALYAGSVLLIELIGVVFWLAYLSRLPEPLRSHAPRSSRAALLAALVAGFVGLGLVYKAWLAAPAAFPALALVAEYVGARRRSG